MGDDDVMVGWQVQCQWVEGGAGFMHKTALIGDERKALKAFRAECAEPHSGVEIEVRLVRFERGHDGWRSGHQVDSWVPKAIFGPWTSEGRLLSMEPPVIDRSPKVSDPGLREA